MKALTVNGNRKAQEYMTSGAVIASAGAMFMAGSLQLTQAALTYARWMAIALSVSGVLLMGAGLGMRSARASQSGKTAAKATTTNKRHGKKR